MRRKVERFLVIIILIALAMPNIAYAQPIPEQTTPYGPRVADLRNKENILKNLQEIKKIRSNLTVIDMTSNSTAEELKSIDANLTYYIQQLHIINTNLEKHESTYIDSFSDVFFSEQISFIADSYIISLRYQQNLVRSVGNNIEEAKRLFYSSYLIPVYHYLTLGDEMIAYIETYFTFA